MERTARTMNCGGKGGKPGPCPSAIEHAKGVRAAKDLGGQVPQKYVNEADKVLQKSGNAPTEINLPTTGHKDFIKSFYEKRPPVIGDTFIAPDGTKAEVTKVNEIPTNPGVQEVDLFIIGKKKSHVMSVYVSKSQTTNSETIERVAVHNSGKLREATLNGKKYIVARATLIVPGVLSGSQGALYYPPEEVAQNVDAWNGMPLVLGHPTNNGAHISARSPDVVERFGLGYVFNAQIRKGRLVAETWFDVAQTERNAPQVLNKLRKGQPVELSTGLFTVNHPAGKGAVYNGKAYQYVARSYRPDHLAILVDQPGACSLKDGCGVLANNCDCESCATKNELSGAKACEIARDGTVHGKKLTKKQKGLFGAKCGESKENNMTGNCGGKGGKPGPCPTKSKPLSGEELDKGILDFIRQHGEVSSGTNSAASSGKDLLDLYAAVGHGKKGNSSPANAALRNLIKSGKIITETVGSSRIPTLKLNPTNNSIGDTSMIRNCGGKGGKPGPCPVGKKKKGDVSQTKVGAWVVGKNGLRAAISHIYSDVPANDKGRLVHIEFANGKGVNYREKDLVFSKDQTSKWAEKPTENSSEDTSMTKKDKMVRYLTANCECWKGKDDAKTLAALPDDKLKALVDNAKRAKEAAEVVGNLLSTLSEDEEQPITANELPTLVANMKGAMKKGAFEKAPAEEEEAAMEEPAESDMEEMAGKKPAFMKNAKKKGKYGMSLNQERDEERVAPTLNEWLESAPPEVRSVIANAQRIEQKQKLEIVAELVGNSRAKTKADKEALHKFLMAKPLDELQTLNQLAPAPRKAEPIANAMPDLSGYLTEHRMPDYSGLGEVEEFTANADDEDDTTLEDAPLAIPTVNWAEEAKLTLPGRERK